MKKKMVIGFALLVCLFCLPLFTKKVSAATTEITPMTISRPGEIDENKDADLGIMYTEEEGTGDIIYTITIPERGWLIIDKNKEYYFPRLFKNASLTSRIMHIRSYDGENNFGRMFFYVDAGKYYLLSRDNNYDCVTYGYFLPDSAAINHKLVKDKDNNGYTDTISFTPNLGTTYLRSGIVAPEDINNGWGNASTNADDIYSISENGEYTIKAAFTDTEWKDFPVMYSFSVYDIGKESKDSKTKDDSKTTDVKLNYTSKTIKVGENFKLKVTGAKVVSFKSSKKSVAKVTASGKVVGKKKGTATIKVTCDNGETYFCKVKVVKK